MISCVQLPVCSFTYVFIFSSIAVYKALYKSFGGFAADVVAAIDQVYSISVTLFSAKNLLFTWLKCIQRDFEPILLCSSKKQKKK